MKARTIYSLTMLLVTIFLMTACEKDSVAVIPGGDNSGYLLDEVDEQSDMRATDQTPDPQEDKVVPESFSIDTEMKAKLTYYIERPDDGKEDIATDIDSRPDGTQSDHTSRYELEASGEFNRKFPGPCIIDLELLNNPKEGTLTGTITLRSTANKDASITFTVYGSSDLESVEAGVGHTFRLSVVEAKGIYTAIEPWANGSITGMEAMYEHQERTIVQFTMNGLYQAG